VVKDKVEDANMEAMALAPVAEVEPSTWSLEMGPVVPIPTLPVAVTFNTDVPVEDDTLKMSLLPAVPWRLNVTVLDVALTPATVALSNSRPVVRAEAEDQTASLPGTPVPVMEPLPQEVVYREPEVTATQPVPREFTVVEPLLAMVNWEAPEEEATTKMLVAGKVEVPWTERVAMGEEEPMPTRPLALTVK
jgi:hypothetical protein